MFGQDPAIPGMPPIPGLPPIPSQLPAIPGYVTQAECSANLDSAANANKTMGYWYAGGALVVGWIIGYVVAGKKRV